jgi:glycosyltransferase involved in cell wall biosynthesis
MPLDKRPDRRIAFIVQLPKNVSPGQRFRLEQYEELLTSNGFLVDTFPFFDEETYQILYKKGFLRQKILGVFKGFLLRILFLRKAHHYGFIFLQREFAPIGPPIFEYLIAKVLKKKIIYDFDDAIWIPAVSDGNKLAGFLKCFWKIGYICKWSYKISPGNAYLAQWVKKYNNMIVINPTCVDVEDKFKQLKTANNDRVTIGWTGSHSTLKYLDIIYPVLQRLEGEFEFEFLVICNQSPSFQLKSMKFIPWKEETEIEDLSQIDIGVMPLVADAWSEGKCGFKIIQYLALGIPAVASPVGVNKDIVEEGKNGFLCSTEDEWYLALKNLLEDGNLRAEMGKLGREKIVKEYSIQANAENFLSLFT